MRYTAEKQSVNYYRDQNYRAVIAVWLVTSERFAHSKIHHLIIMRYNRCHSNDNPGSPHRLLDFASIAPIRIDPRQPTHEFRDTVVYTGCPRQLLNVLSITNFIENLSYISHNENFAITKFICRGFSSSMENLTILKLN